MIAEVTKILYTRIIGSGKFKTKKSHKDQGSVFFLQNNAYGEDLNCSTLYYCEINNSNSNSHVLFVLQISLYADEFSLTYFYMY